MVHVKDSESGEELDNVPSWKEDGGLEYTVGGSYAQRRGTTGSAVAEVPGCIQDVACKNQSHQARHTHC